MAKKVIQPAVKVVVYWGDVLYDTVLCAPKSDVTVGRKPGSTFLMDIPEVADTANFPLLKVLDAANAELRFTKYFDGHVKLNAAGGAGANAGTGSLVSLGNAINRQQARTNGDGFYQLAFNAGDKAEVVLNHVTFHLDWVTDQSTLPRGNLFARSNVISTIAFLALVVPFLYLVNSDFLKEKEEKPPERLVQIIPRIEKPKEVRPIEKKPVEEAEAAAGQRKTKDGGAEKGALGKADLVPPKAEKVKKAAIAKAPPTNAVAKPVDAATSTAQTLRNANLSSVLKGLSSLGAAEAPDAKPVRGAIEAPIAQEGTGGFSTEGLKKGGGGKSVGIGRTVGQGEGGFEGTGRLGLSGTTIGSKGTGRGRETTSVEGGLDREVIDNIIRQRKDRIRLCYERQLNFKPKLSGKLVVQFVIGKDGNVLQSSLIEDTMKDDNVKQCLLAEVKSWTFPKPQGGTVVTVDYPFVFESGSR